LDSSSITIIGKNAIFRITRQDILMLKIDG